MTFLIFYCLAIIAAFIHLYLSKVPLDAKRYCRVYFLYLIVTAGIMSLWASAGHIFFADEVASYIGWQRGSPFQFEVGIANLAMGVLSILCIWQTEDFWFATVITLCILGYGTGYGHIMQIKEFNNYHPGNAGPVLYVDFIAPTVTIILYWVYRFASTK